MPATDTIKNKGKQIAGKATRKGMIRAAAACFGSWACVAILAILIILFTTVIILYIVQQSENTTASNNKTDCGLSETQLTKYQGGGAAVSCTEAKGGKAKNDAVALGISAEDMKNPGEQSMANMIRAEIAKQWAQVPENEKHGSTQMDAEKGILIYAEGENEGLGHFNSDGSVAVEDCGGLSTLQPLSVTVDKYNGSYNSQIAAFWDQKYTIYLGVKENIDKFRQKASGEGWARWDNNWNVVWGGAWPARSKLTYLKQKVDSLVTEEYKCQTASSSSGGKYFPVVGYSDVIPTGSDLRAFGAARSTGCAGRRHCGVDLDAPPGTQVIAVNDGKVVDYIVNFYGGTDALMVDDGTNVINYGEIRVDPQFQTVGATVKAGEKIGIIIANNIGGSSMVHFELYTPGTTVNAHWCPPDKPANLLDPTSYLQNLLNQSKK